MRFAIALTINVGFYSWLLYYAWQQTGWAVWWLLLGVALQNTAENLSRVAESVEAERRKKAISDRARWGAGR